MIRAINPMKITKVAIVIALFLIVFLFWPT